MLFKNETEQPKNIRIPKETGLYDWRWVEPNQTIELDEIIGGQNGLARVQELDPKPKEQDSAVESTKKKSKNVQTKKKK